MSDSLLVRAIQERLRQAGYIDVKTPFTLAGVEFAFTGVMRGSDGRALDLILLVDTTTGSFGDREVNRVRQRIEALSRALDVTASRYVLTAILAGAFLGSGIELLSETCRVLTVESLDLNEVGQPIDQAAKQSLDDRLSILLPLALPEANDAKLDGNGPALVQLAKALPSDISKPLLDAVIAASARGDTAVSDAVGRAIATAFKGLGTGA